MNLHGRTLILTGASKGIGRALALELAQSGANLVLNARSKVPLEEIAAKVREKNAETATLAGDAAVAENSRQMVSAAIDIGEFLGFIHNAGVNYPGPLLHELPEAGFEEIWRSNVLAGYHLAYSSYHELRRLGRGLAVFLGSGAAECNLPGIGAYSLAKAAEEHMARQLAAETPEVTCFVYRPGAVETEMQKLAREARGSGAETLHEIFRGFKDRGILLTPEQAAQALVKIIQSDPRRFHGRIATYKDGL